MSRDVGISSFLAMGFSIVGKPKEIDPTDSLGVVTRNRHAGPQATRASFSAPELSGDSFKNITALKDPMGQHWLIAADDRQEIEGLPVSVFALAEPKDP